jgi:hypothetical protein
MDDLLQDVADCWFKLAQAQAPELNITYDIVARSMLQVYELIGEAVSYVDWDGTTRWKASPKLQRAFEEGDN